MARVARVVRVVRGRTTRCGWTGSWAATGWGGRGAKRPRIPPYRPPTARAAPPDPPSTTSERSPPSPSPVYVHAVRDAPSQSRLISLDFQNNLEFSAPVATVRYPAQYQLHRRLSLPPHVRACVIESASRATNSGRNSSRFSLFALLSPSCPPGDDRVSLVDPRRNNNNARVSATRTTHGGFLLGPSNFSTPDDDAYYPGCAGHRQACRTQTPPPVLPHPRRSPNEFPSGPVLPDKPPVGLVAGV